MKRRLKRRTSVTRNRIPEDGTSLPQERHPAFQEKRNAQDIIGVIVNGQSGFSKSNRRIAEAILHEPHRFVEMPIEELTGWLNVSAPTVTRFARTVGCDRLKELKLKTICSVRVGIMSGLSTSDGITISAHADTPSYFAADSGACINQHFKETESRIHAL
jgi:DNA-binding MurR/RpiR family transcriptional regulator